MKQAPKGFTLIEILIGILIVSFVLLAGFQALSAVWIGKIKLIEKTRIEKEAYYASEKFFEMIKKWWTIDFEEYWNRTSYDTNYSSWHYEKQTGMGNEGTLYFCMSPNGSSMGTGGCLENNLYKSDATPLASQKNEKQRYGEYELQFIDYNSDQDGNTGDEDNSWESELSFLGDADDLYLGIGPRAFSWSKVGELYLINDQGNERTFFRWNVKYDSFAPPGSTCDGTHTMTGTGCLGTIEFLKLTGKDEWYTANDIWDWDGKIESWYIHEDFLSSLWEVKVTSSNSEQYWQPIFSDNINVKDVQFFLYPNKDIQYSWKDTDTALSVSEYLWLQMTLQPSWKEKRKIRGTIPTVEISTSISLSQLNLQ